MPKIDTANTDKLAKILLVEDNANDVELTLAALAEYQLANEVVVARDGQEALDYLLREGAFVGRPEGNPAVVMLDLKLPKIDGKEVLHRIKTDALLKLIPVVVLTSSSEERDLAESYQLGGNAYVIKPVEFHDFIEAVKSLSLFWAITNHPPAGSAGSGGGDV
jgi:CheY-like chemotaxis protein